MNRRTVAIEQDNFELIVKTMQEGFEHEGVQYKPNERIATILVLEYNLGISIGDILNLTMESFVRDGSRYRFDTDKYHNLTIPDEIYHYIQDYAYRRQIPPNAKLFAISIHGVLKHLSATCRYLGLSNIAAHSFRKGFATRIYIDSNYNIELVRRVMQHFSVGFTQRYIEISEKHVEDALTNNINLCQ